MEVSEEKSMINEISTENRALKLREKILKSNEKEISKDLYKDAIDVFAQTLPLHDGKHIIFFIMNKLFLRKRKK